MELRRLPLGVASLRDVEFVGRDAELALLERAWQRARTGGREVVLIAGEPGVGKTTLAAKLATRLHDSGALVMFGRCDEEGPVPFQPFVEAIGHHFDTTPPEELRALLGRQAADLTLLVPRLAIHLPELAGAARTGGETERYRLFEAVGSLLVAIGARGPVVLVLDDLHWADRPTLQLLTHVIRKVVAAPLLIVGTYRDTDLVRTHPMAEALVELRRASLVERVPLRGLAPDDVEALVTGGLPAGPADAELARALWEETEGSPLFLREILRHLEETGAIARVDDGRRVASRRIAQLGIPEGVKEVIGRRLTRLSETANTTLRIGSVLGRELRLDVLERVTDLGGDELLDAFDEAISAGIVEELPTGAGRWTFTHALVREALYEELSLTRRVRLHLRVGEALEDLHGDDPSERLAELAFHFSQAAVAGGADKAIDYARRAGRHAVELAGYEEAVRHFSMALEVADDAGADAAVRADILLERGDAEHHAGNVRGARESFERVVALVGDDDPDRLARAAIGYAGSRARLWWTQIGRTEHVGVGLLRRALDALPADDGTRRADVMACLARELHWESSRVEERSRLSADAVAMARRLGDTTTLAHVLANRMLAMATTEHAPELVVLAREAHDAARALGDRRLTAFTTVYEAIGLMMAGDIRAASAAVEVASAEFETLKDPVGRHGMLANRAGIAALEGRFGDAERMLADAFTIAQEVRDPNGFVVYAGAVAFARDLEGRAIELLSVVERMLAHFPELQTVAYSLSASLLAEAGLLEEARLRLQRMSLRDEVPFGHNFWLPGAYFTARAAARLGDAETGRWLYELMAPYAESFASAGPITFGPTTTMLGWCSIATGDLDRAVEHLAASLAVADDLGWVAYRAWVALFLARALLLRGAGDDHDRARELLARSAAIAEELGMLGVTAEAAELSSRLAGSAPAPAERTVTMGDRVRGRLSRLGRSAVAAWTAGRTDDDIERAFGSAQAQRLLFAAVARSFQPAMAVGFQGDIAIELRPLDDDGDPAASDWWTLEVRGRRATAEPGNSPGAEVRIRMPLPDFLRLAAGELDPVVALLESSVEVEGDPMVAARLGDMFGAVKPLDLHAPGADQLS